MAGDYDEDTETKPLLQKKDVQEEEISRPKRAITIEPVIMLYFMASAPIFYIAEQYIYSRIAKEHGFDFDSRNKTSQCVLNKTTSIYRKEQLVQKITSHWVLILQICLTAPQILSTVMFGAYSDKVGRKIAVIVPMIGSAMRAYTCIAVITFKLPIAWMILGSLFEGFSGGIGLNLLGGLAYAADISTTENRSFRITAIEMSIGFGVAIANVASGHLIRLLGYAWPFVIICGIHTVNFFYTFFFLPETIKRQEDARFLTISHFKAAIKLYVKDNGTNRKWKMIILVIVFYFSEMVIAGAFATQALKLQKSPLCFNSILLGYWSGISALTAQMGTMIAIKLFQKRLGISDHWFAVFGTFGGMATKIFFGLADTKLLVFLVPIVGLMGNMVLPMVRSMQSKMVEPSETGALFASHASLRAICVISSQALFTATYAATLHIWDATAFFLMAGNSFISLILIIIYIVKLRRESQKNFASIN